MCINIYFEVCDPKGSCPDRACEVYCVGLVILCFIKLPEDGTPMLKYVGVNT